MSVFLFVECILTFYPGGDAGGLAGQDRVIITQRRGRR